MEHELSAVYGVTHGAGLAVIVPAWLTFMVEHNPARLRNLHAECGMLLKLMIKKQPLKVLKD
jgi:alcohol dehydrogenase YqhD (iron-dependent ADH family)